MLELSRDQHKKAFASGRRCVVDFETRGVLKLGKGKDTTSAYRYAEHPLTSILCLSYVFEDEDEPSIWWPFYGEPFPERLRQAVLDGDVVFEAHNAGFERAIWREKITPVYGVPLPATWVDTMAACAYRTLPLGLDKVCEVLNLDEGKDKRGKFLLNKLSKPQKLTKADIKAGKVWPNWNEDPTLMEELGVYCKQDVRAERGLSEAIKDLPEAEQAVWEMDQEINDWGVCVDHEAIKAADKIRLEVEARLEKELVKITGGAVEGGSELKKIMEWVDAQGVFIPDLTADTIDEYLDKHSKVELPGNVRAVLEIRRVLSRASAKKLIKLQSMLCRDGRIKGHLAYHGASTGRWAGRGPQFHNLPRPDEALFINDLDENGEEIEGSAMERLIAAVKMGDSELLELFYGDPMAALASTLRGLIVAEEGSDLYVADFSAIEARVLAWVAGEQWKLDAFAAIDRKEGYKGSQDIYLATASGVFGYPCLTKKTHAAERQVGKTCELAFGYQGGVGAWRKFDDSDKWTDEQVNEKKLGWRAAHPNVVQFWYGIEEAALNAVRLRRTTRYRSITFSVVKSSVGDWLACKLPNGRCLWYFHPNIQKVPHPYRKGEWKEELHYEGRDSKRNGAWSDIKTYGGMLTENIVQAISRDLMVEAMFRVRAAGYPIMLTIHDEIIGERKRNTGGDFNEYCALMAEIPDWIKGIPIAVSGYIATRYRKD